jgi:hypothetical protein
MLLFITHVNEIPFTRNGVVSFVQAFSSNQQDYSVRMNRIVLAAFVGNVATFRCVCLIHC